MRALAQSRGRLLREPTPALAVNEHVAICPLWVADSNDRGPWRPVSRATSVDGQKQTSRATKPNETAYGCYRPGTVTAYTLRASLGRPAARLQARIEKSRRHNRQDGSDVAAVRRES